MPRRSSKIALICYCAVAGIDLVAELSAWPRIALGCRVLLMPLLIWLCWAGAERRTRLVILVAVALAFSWLGDVVGVTILLKIGLFLVAQIVYIVAFRPYWRRSLIGRRPLLITYGTALAAVIGIVASQAGPLTVAVAIYGAGLALMAVLATGVDRLTGLGGTLFLLSDIVLAVEFFVAPGAIPSAAAINMALYLPGQLMITLGVLQQVSVEVRSVVADPVA
ncbi:MAG TPA: lysoplasmalogenase [Microlunatus sp.]|nr:lysoplasmalogenase [Microlunatus sp.]